MKLSLKLFRTKTEAALWLLFFLILTAFGFLRGWNPEITASRLLGPPVRFEILTISPAFFPPEVMTEIEKQMGVRIQITPIKNWEDLHLKLVADTEVNLLFLPVPWVQALSHENLLKSDPSLRRLNLDLVSPDFNLNPDSPTQDFMAIYWGRMAFFSNLPAPKSLGLSEDADMGLAILEKWKTQKQDSLIAKMKFQLFPLEQWASLDIPKTDAVFAPHLWSQKHPGWLEISGWPELLDIWGFALPKNSGSSAQAEALIRAYTQISVQSKILQELPLASTLLGMDERPGPLEQKALYLRDLGLMKMNLIPPHDPTKAGQVHDFFNLNFSH